MNSQIEKKSLKEQVKKDDNLELISEQSHEQEMTIDPDNLNDTHKQRKEKKSDELQSDNPADQRFEMMKQRSNITYLTNSTNN